MQVGGDLGLADRDARCLAAVGMPMSVDQPHASPPFGWVKLVSSSN
jgi:hypothetical protein